ncbi:hypothetical protein [Shewanella sp. GXUN23E]|uniref:hypothetical protein n=1 Tax=Shewanella sp. GXUN23E TaxID=3422498 RepID=UPI003D7EBA0E
MKRLMVLLWLAGSAWAGDIKVHDQTEQYDPFAVRDSKRAEHQWQEQQNLQRQLELIDKLPVGCLLVSQPSNHYRCGNDFFRPYPQPRDGQGPKYQRIPKPVKP